MSRIRSPNYPSISLPEAIARIKIIHEKEQHLTTTKDVIAKHMGYNSLNGSALKALSALSKYGLIEEVNGEKFKVSSLAQSILHPRTPKERSEAIRDAASRPALFVEIATEWPDGIPSDENLKSYLIRKAFAADAIDRVIKSFRDTINLVAAESGEYTLLKRDSVQPEEPPFMQQPQTPPQSQPQRSPAPSLQTSKGYDIGFVGTAIRMSGIVGTKSEAEKVIKALQALQDLLPDDDDVS